MKPRVILKRVSPPLNIRSVTIGHLAHDTLSCGFCLAFEMLRTTKWVTKFIAKINTYDEQRCYRFIICCLGSLKLVFEITIGIFDAGAFVGRVL